ncbi:MAG: hypothetical protein OXU71_04815 [Gammaproteobacteria bacterium]|nr:hypothetical protein [Gammaproteobacteria bacterium]
MNQETNQATAQQGRDFYAAMTDPAVRRQYRADPRAAYQASLARAGDAPELAADVEIKVVSNTADTFYVALARPDEETLLSDRQLRHVQAAGGTGSTGSAGTLFCASSFGTLCGTASTAGSAGSVSTSGSD